MKAIADTGFLVAFASCSDQHHEWAEAVASQVEEPLLTCEAVLAETAFHLRNAAVVLDFVREGLVCPSFDVLENLLPLASLARHYADRKADLADLCLIRMSELYPAYPIITVDRSDFAVYRRNKRDPIPTILPPA